MVHLADQRLGSQRGGNNWTGLEGYLRRYGPLSELRFGSRFGVPFGLETAAVSWGLAPGPVWRATCEDTVRFRTSDSGVEGLLTILSPV